MGYQHLRATPSAFRPVILAGAALLVLLEAGAAESSPAGAMAALTEPFQPPDWLAATPVPFSPQRLTETNTYGLTFWQSLADLQNDPAQFRSCVAALHAALELNREPKLQADCIQALAIDYEMMFQDSVRACQLYRQLADLAVKVPKIHDPQNHLSRDTARTAALAQARNCALLGLKSPAEERLQDLDSQDWRELLDIAVVRQLLGDRQAAAVVAEQAIAAGAKGDPFAQTSACGRGVIFLYANGSAELARKYLPQYAEARERTLRKEGKLPANLAGQDACIKIIAANAGQRPALRLDDLVDGAYVAAANGMDGPVAVTIAVKDARVATLKVAAQEKRAFGAVAEVTRRILATQALPVDAVSGATVTSLMIEQAVAQGLAKATRKEPR